MEKDRNKARFYNHYKFIRKFVDRNTIPKRGFRSFLLGICDLLYNFSKDATLQELKKNKLTFGILLKKKVKFQLRSAAFYKIRHTTRYALKHILDTKTLA